MVAPPHLLILSSFDIVPGGRAEGARGGDHPDANRGCVRLAGVAHRGGPPAQPGDQELAYSRPVSGCCGACATSAGTRVAKFTDFFALCATGDGWENACSPNHQRDDRPMAMVLSEAVFSFHCGLCMAWPYIAPVLRGRRASLRFLDRDSEV